MTCTIVAQVVDRLGHASWEPARRWVDGVEVWRSDRNVGAHPAASFTDQQPGRIPITVDHNGDEVGQVLYLAHGLDGCTDLTAVGVLPGIDADLVTGLHCSADVSFRSHRGDSVADSSRLDSLALVASTAGVAARAVQAWPGDYRNPADRQDWQLHRMPAVLTRAVRDADSIRRWARPQYLCIARPTGFDARIALGLEPNENGWGNGTIFR